MADYADIKSIRNFKSLVKYLRTRLDWPIDEDDAQDWTFDYEPAELGLDEKAAVKIREIKQVRPLADGQPWGIFWIDFEPKRLPVVVMRRILATLVRKQRASKRSRQAIWNLDDLMFISATGQGSDRGLSFAHFHETGDGQPQLRTFSWDVHERHFYYLERVNLEALRWPVDPNEVDAWRERWASAFTAGHREVIKTAQQLASRMADLAASTRSLVNEVYQYEKPGGVLHKLYNSFKRVLIHDLSVDDFADMYAQTVTYGLFSARATRTGEFALENVVALIPSTNPFLRDLLAECLKVSTGGKHQIDLDELGVGELVETLKRVDIEAILRDFGRQTRGEDPVIHFYESFLREYDPEKKVRRGVFYTPDPVVSFIVRSVDYLLRTEFDCPDGLADTTTMKWKGQMVPKVQILDPATGTGTFLKYVIEQVHSTFYEKHKKLSAAERKKKWNEYVPKHLLKRLYGFELMMAPYAVAHLKLGLELKKTEYEFGSDERLHVYLTNTLLPAEEIPRVDTAFLSHEADEANTVEAETPITAVIGNPPYSNFGMMNKGSWILGLLEDYKKGLNEKKLNLDDDFIKFVRFAQWRIDQTGNGILAFITNNTYIDGITHRRMRQSLLETFDDIYILDLHGNSLKRETAPDGSKDENVFDIQQGVAVAVFVQRTDKRGNHRILHADLWGLRQHKYETLTLSDFSSIEWGSLNPTAPYFFFVPKDFSLEQEYRLGHSLEAVFEIEQNGIKTDRDELFFDFDKDELEKRMRKFYSREGMTSAFREQFRIIASSSYDIEARRDRTHFRPSHIRSCLYRPFDIRWLYYDPALTSRPAYDVMRHML